MSELRNAYMTGYRARTERGLNWETSVANGRVRNTVANREAFMVGYRARAERGLTWENYLASKETEVLMVA